MDKEVKRLLLISMLMCYLTVPGWIFYLEMQMLAWFGPIVAGFYAGMMSRSILSALLACLLIPFNILSSTPFLAPLAVIVGFI